MLRASAALCGASSGVWMARRKKRAWEAQSWGNFPFFSSNNIMRIAQWTSFLCKLIGLESPLRQPKENLNFFSLSSCLPYRKLTHKFYCLGKLWQCFTAAKRVDSWHLNSFRYLFLVNKLLCLPPSVSKRVVQQLISVKFISYLQPNFWLLLLGCPRDCSLSFFFNFILFMFGYDMMPLFCLLRAVPLEESNMFCRKDDERRYQEKKEARQWQKNPNETLIKREKFPYYGNNSPSTRYQVNVVCVRVCGWLYKFWTIFCILI